MPWIQRGAHRLKRGALPLNALRAFESTARLGTMTAAANELCVTHSAVSRQIKGLENLLGVRLFEGSRTRLVLSDQAKRLLPQLTLAFDAIQEAMYQVGGTQNDVVSVSCLGTLTMRWLIPMLHDFRNHNPEVEIRLSADDGPIDLRRSTADVAIRVGRQFGKGVVVTPLFEDAVGPVLSPRILPEGGLTEPAQIGSLPLLHTRTRAGAWEDWAEAQGISLNLNGSEFEHFYFMLEAAIAGLGVAIAPIVLVRDDIAAGRLLAPFGFSANGMQYVALNLPGARVSILRFVSWLASAAGPTGSLGSVKPVLPKHQSLKP